MSFDAHHIETPESKKTDYALDGKVVCVTAKRGRPPKIRNPLFIPQDKKIEACALYCVLGDVKKVSEMAKVPEKELRQWREEPWWAEVQRKIMVEQNEGLLAKINSTVELALGMLEDRILKGDCIVEKESGEQVRIPIKARDLSQIFHALTHQRNLMTGQATSIVSTTSTEDRLEFLRANFKQLAKGNVIDAEVTELKEES